MRNLLYRATLFTMFLCVTAHAQAMLFQYQYTPKDGLLTTGSGTCFSISKDEVLTCKHLLYSDDKLQDNIYVTLHDKRHKMTIVRECKELDIAILKINDGTELTPLEFGEDANEGELTFMGCPLSLPVETRKGVLETRFYMGSLDLAQVSFNHGMSGCPVLKDGKIVGMATSGTINKKGNDMDFVHALYLPASVLKWFINQKTGKEKGGKK